MSTRTEKVSSTIKKIIVNPINQLANEYKAGLVTVTAVRITPDLQLAKVYISILASKVSEGKFLAILEDNKKKIRHFLAKNIRLKHIPELKFFLDNTLDEMNHIKQLIDEVNKTSKDIKVNPEDYDNSIFQK